MRLSVLLAGNNYTKSENIWRCLNAYILKVLNQLKRKRSLLKHLWSLYGGQSGGSGHETFQLDQVEFLTNSVSVFSICRKLAGSVWGIT
jgi:hypothetical protein